MANTKEFNISSNAVTVLNQTADAAENTAKGFTSAKAELRALQQQLLTMDQSSEEFKKASARAAELKDNISDLSAEISANAGNAFEGLSNNVSLFGSRLMDLDFKGAGQALTAMGGAVGRIDFKTLKDEVGGLVGGLANLGKAVLANPFFLAAGALTAMIVYYKEIGDAINGTAEKVKKLEESNVVLEKQNLILDNRITKEKTLYGESFKTLELEKEKALNNVQVAENELAIARTTGDINTIREKENKLIETRNLLSGITAKGEADRQKLIEDAKNLTIKGYKEEQERQAAIAKFEDARAQQLAVIAEKQRLIKANLQKEELIGTEQQYTVERANFVEKDIETKKVLVQSDRQKQLQAELNQLIEEEQILRNAKVAIATNTTVNELKAQELALQKELNKEGKTAEQLQKEADDYNKSQQELTDILSKWEQERLDAKLKAEQDYIHANQSAQANELYDLEQKKNKEIEVFEGTNEEKVLILETYRILEENINKKYDDLALEQQIASNEKLKAEDEKAKEEAKKREEDLAKAKLDAEKQLYEARWGLATASVDLLGTLFAKNKKAADVAFALEKGLAVAKIIVDTQAEIAGYYAANAAAGPAGMAVASAQALAAKIRAATSIATIAGTTVAKFMNGGSTSTSSGGGTVSGSTGGTQAPSPANFAFLQNQPNQLQPPLQAYVVSGQVSSNLELQQLINNQSRLGG